MKPNFIKWFYRANHEKREWRRKHHFAQERIRRVVTRIDEVERIRRKVELVYQDVLKAIGKTKNLDYIDKLVRAALSVDDENRPGTTPGSIGWMYTQRLLDDPEITNFCPWCFINCYGAAQKPIIMPCEVPGCPWESPDSMDVKLAGLDRSEKRKTVADYKLAAAFLDNFNSEKKSRPKRIKGAA